MIRPYKLKDKKELIDVFKQNIPTYFDLKEVKDFQDYLQKYSASYYTIFYKKKIVGGVGCYLEGKNRIGRITWIFFHPKYTGLGLGKKAIEHSLSILKLSSELEKVVVTTSQLAYKFFEKFGFVLEKIEKDYWGLGLDLYLMELSFNNNS
ncbi:Acetyltransferase (GNAT) domain-containing protein [Aquimarina amphilecti]|uniref:Acetyltransferase (GNAT) domain-containing protein n=1 Tax=Aquimarina amphilecti TaxID=1038014 RepID=A0A1H7SHG7_AQUAM|nr:GNAT family N-acetyltransferase [Aquimarina amphilecti]SEL71789.1 Acetyltransferase (GNAT) domain-containing protein [Aquimarina amphilecti]